MTPAELAALRALLDDATPGPWIESYAPKAEGPFLTGEPRYRRVARTGVEHGVYGPDIGEDRVIANGELIARLRNDANALLDAAEEALRLRAELESRPAMQLLPPRKPFIPESAVENPDNDIEAERDRLAAEVDRLVRDSAACNRSLHDEIDLLRRLLRMHGRHTGACEFERQPGRIGSCTCGLDGALTPEAGNGHDAQA